MPENLGDKAVVARPEQPLHENQPETTHVESTLIPRLDEGSNPSSSTWRVGQIPANKSLNKTKPQNINQFCGFSCLKMTTQDRHRTEKRPQQTTIRYQLVTAFSKIKNGNGWVTISAA